MIAPYSGCSPAIPFPAHRLIWFALCSGNIGSAPWSRNTPPEYGGSAASSGPMPRHSLDSLTGVSELWMNPCSRIRNFAPIEDNPLKEVYGLGAAGFTFISLKNHSQAQKRLP